MSDSEDNSTTDSGDFSLPPESINPYTVLCIPPTSTVNEIRAAYRRLALQTHPDKVPPAEREAAHVKFQEVAFAYAILNDQDRRARYDATGSTSENVFEEGFDWKDFFRAQVKDLVSPEAVERFKKEYQGSDEERSAVLQAYTDTKGSLDEIFQRVMVSSVLDDEDRFRIMIQQAIDAGEVEAYRAFTKESAKSKKARRDLAESEKKEAEEYAKELGVWDVLFGEKKKRKEEQEAAEAVGDVEMDEAQDDEDDVEETKGNTSGKGKGKGRTAKRAEPVGGPSTRVKKTKAKKEDDTSALENLIKNRQANRQAGFLASLEAKYGVDGTEVKKEKKGRETGRGRKAVDEDLDGDTAEPTEEEFQAAKKRLKSGGGKKRTGGSGKAENSTAERRSKRNKP